MTDTTARTDRQVVATDDPALETSEQTADAETSAEARTAEVTTGSATTMDQRERLAAQPAGGAATAPPAGATASAGATPSAPHATTPASAAGVQASPADVQASPTSGATIAASSETALFDAGSSKDFQRRWQTIQVGFVDEPRAAVEQADKLVEEVLAKLQESFGRERQDLEQAWSGGNEASTEDLRQAIRRYRSFFNRLLSI